MSKMGYELKMLRLKYSNEIIRKRVGENLNGDDALHWLICYYNK